MTERVAKALETVRPYLQADNGDITLDHVSEDGIAYVRFTGACKSCPMASMTLRAGVERVVMREVPGIRRVEAIQ